MRSLVKNIAAVFAITCFVAAFYLSCQPEQKPTALSSPDWTPIDTGDLMPAALRVVPGRSWERWSSGDSISANGIWLLSQNGNTDQDHDFLIQIVQLLLRGFDLLHQFGQKFLMRFSDGDGIGLL